MIKKSNSSKGRTVTVLKCQQCGAPLNVITNSQLIKCESCGTINKLPEVGNLKIEVSSKDDVYKMSSAEQMLSNLYDEAIIWKQKGYYQRSLEKFSEIKAYRDSAQQIEELEITIDNEEKYQEAIKYIKQKLYKDAMVLLKEILSYKNADELYENCKRLIEAKGIKNKEGKNITDYIIIPLVLISIIPFIIGLSIIISSFIPKEEIIIGSINEEFINENKSTVCRRYFYRGWYSQVYALDKNYFGFLNKEVVFTEKSANFEAFKFKNLESAIIESDVENLPSFYSCLKLRTIEFKNECKVKKIKSTTFDRCEKLISIVIPDGVKEIKTQAFRNCSNLRTVIIPASVELIERFAFDNCNKVKIYAEPEEKPEGWAEQFVIEGNNTPCVYWYSETYKENCWRYVDGGPKVWEKYDNCDFYVEEKEDGIKITGIKDKTVTEIIVPETIEGKQVIEITEGAFSGCSNLKKITLPFIGNSIKEEENTNFYCIFKTVPMKLTEVIITGGIKVDDNAFSTFGGHTIKSITLPKTIKSIGWHAFAFCSLEKIIYKGTMTDWLYTVQKNEYWWNFSFSDNETIYCTDCYTDNLGKTWYKN